MLYAEKLSASYILLKNCVMLETKWRCWTELIYSQFNQDISQNKPSVWSSVKDLIFVIWISFSAQRWCLCSRPQFHKIKKKNKKKTIKLWTKSLYKWGFHIIIMSLSWTHTLLSCMHVTWNENNSVEACTSILTYLQWCNRKGYFHSLSTHHADGKLGEVSKSKRYFKAGIFTAKLKALACTSSGGGARARPGVEGVNNIFSK